MSAPGFKHVERIASFANEGHLYRFGEAYFLVYTGESGIGWDVCPTALDKRGTWPFQQPIVHGAKDRQAALLAARELLTSSSLP